MADYSNRRADTEYQCHAERMIGYAIQAVEEMPADERLTAAVLLLQQAQHKVADWMEDPEEQAGAANVVQLKPIRCGKR
jgi:hypothetical protein